LVDPSLRGLLFCFFGYCARRAPICKRLLLLLVRCDIPPDIIRKLLLGNAGWPSTACKEAAASRNKTDCISFSHGQVGALWLRTLLRLFRESKPIYESITRSILYICTYIHTQTGSLVQTHDILHTWALSHTLKKS